MHPLPSPELPAVIVGVSRGQDERSHQLGGRHKIVYPSGAEVVVLDEYLLQATPKIEELVTKQVLKPGVVLVRSPFGTGTYAPESDAELLFEREKLLLVSSLCQILGATRVESDTSTLHVQRRVTTVKAKLGKKVGRIVAYKGEGQMTLEEREQWQSRLQVNDTYPGAAPDISAAREFVTLHSLNDPEIAGLVEARASQNILQERVITVTYEGTNDRNLDVAAQVQLPASSLTVNGRRDHSIRRRVSLKLHITFPKE